MLMPDTPWMLMPADTLHTCSEFCAQLHEDITRSMATRETAYDELLGRPEGSFQKVPLELS